MFSSWCKMLTGSGATALGGGHPGRDGQNTPAYREIHVGLPREQVKSSSGVPGDERKDAREFLDPLRQVRCGWSGRREGPSGLLAVSLQALHLLLSGFRQLLHLLLPRLVAFLGEMRFRIQLDLLSLGINWESTAPTQSQREQARHQFFQAFSFNGSIIGQSGSSVGNSHWWGRKQ